MANQMIMNRKYKNVGVQTGDENELFIYLCNKKTIRVYYSNSYKDKVISFNFGTSKNFIFTKCMWNILLNHLSEINTILDND